MDSQNYLQAHNLESIFKELLSVILVNKPEDPIDFMIHSLNSLKSTLSSISPPSSVKEINLSEFFKNSMLSYPHKSHSSHSSSLFFSNFHPPSNANAINQSKFSTNHQMQSETLSPLNDALLQCSEIPRFNRLRRGSVSAESFVPSRSPLPIPFHPKSEESRARILASIKGNILFKSLESDQLEEIVSAMFQIVVPAGITIIRQGEDGDNFYVVESGSFDIFIDGNKILSVGHGGSFGELALLYNTPRAATVTATQDSQLWALDRVTFRKLLANNIFHKRNLYESFLRSVPIFQTLSGEEISKIADALELCEFQQGSEIIKQGSLGDRFYILLEGEAEVSVASPSSPPQEEPEIVRKMGLLKKGDYFGEISMLTHAPRAATVICVSSHAKCISLQAEAFTRLLGPIKEILKRNMEHYQKYQQYIQ